MELAVRSLRLLGAPVLALVFSCSACGESHEINPAESDADLDFVTTDDDDDQPDARVSTRLDAGAGAVDFGNLVDDFVRGLGGNRDAGARDAGLRDAGFRDAGPADAGRPDASVANQLCAAYPQLPFCPRDAGADANVREAGSDSSTGT